MLKKAFEAVAYVGSQAKQHLSLRRIFGGSVLVAPETTGNFLGSRVTGLFNGVMQGLSRGIMQNPLLIAAGATAAVWVASDMYSKLRR